MSQILAIDPGTTQSGWCRFADGRVLDSGVSPNERILERIRIIGAYADNELIEPTELAIERFEARGMPIGDDSVQTILWTGRFVQGWRDPTSVILVKRSEVKLVLCGTARAKDAHIRQALIDMLGGKGTKANPGATHGVSSHAWAALAVAVVARQRQSLTPGVTVEVSAA